MPGFTAWVGLEVIGQVQGGRDDLRLGCGGRGRQRGGPDRASEGPPGDRQRRQRPRRSSGSARSEIEAFNYRDTPAKEALADGIDAYFDNVGGDQLVAALAALRPFGRVIACGAISRYNDERAEPGPRNLFLMVTKRLRLQGFIVFDHNDRLGEFVAEVGPWVRDGKVAYRETIVEGIENIPSAFAGLFRGDNIGKMLVRVGPDEA